MKQCLYHVNPVYINAIYTINTVYINAVYIVNRVYVNDVYTRVPEPEPSETGRVPHIPVLRAKAKTTVMLLGPVLPEFLYT